MKYIFLIAIGLTVSACNNNQTSASKVDSNTPQSVIQLSDAQIKSAEIHLGYAEQKHISGILKMNGRVDVPPQNLVSISVPLGGYLESTQLLPGMHVKKGEVIATMQDQQYIQIQQEYLTSRSRLELLEAEFKRQQNLNESKSSSDKTVQQAKADYEAVRIAVKSNEEKLKLIHINPAALTEQTISKSIFLRAPFDGFVSKVNVNIGRYVNPSDVLFELVNPSDIHLNLVAFEKDLLQLEIGQKLLAYTNSNPETKHLCEIILISKDISAERTAEVHCHFKKYDKSLFPGMYMNAEVEVQNKSVLSVPEEAIVLFDGKNYLYKAMDKNKFEMTPVQVGVRERGFVEIISGQINVSDKIVTRGAYALLMGLKNKSEE